MRNLTNVIVDTVIVHALAPRSGQKLVSARPVSLANNPALNEYLVKHIELSLGDNTARAARFGNSAPDKPAGITQAMLTNGTDFVGGSQQLADQLYDIMFKNRATADGDLAVCQFHTADRPQEPYLALIKLDPVGVFRNVPRKDAQGREYLDLVLDPNVFSRDVRSLQKGAYVRCIDSRPEFHMLLVDKQAKRGDIALFFRHEWLEATFELDPAELTRLLYLALIEMANQLRPTLQPDEDKRLGLAIYQLFDPQNHQLDLDWGAWIDGLALPDEAKDSLQIALENTFSKQVLTLDMTLVNLLTRRRAFDGEGGLHFGVDTDFAQDVIDSVSHEPHPIDGHLTYKVVLYTDKWNEKP